MILKKGAKGPEVRAWNEFLRKMGHDTDAGDVFGQITHIATLKGLLTGQTFTSRNRPHRGAMTSLGAMFVRLTSILTKMS